jgi:hypothetical protein
MPLNAMEHPSNTNREIASLRLIRLSEDFLVSSIFITHSLFDLWRNQNFRRTIVESGQRVGVTPLGTLRASPPMWNIRSAEIPLKCHSGSARNALAGVEK